MSAKIGKLTGTIANVTRKAFEPFGVSLSDQDFADRKIEDVIRTASDKAKSEFEKQKQDWENRASSSGSEEIIREWERKYKTIEKKVTEIDSARQEAIDQFEQFKTNVAREQKESKINSTFEKELGAIKLDPSVNEFTIRGFKAAIADKYLLDLEDDGTFVVKDKKSAERLKSKDKAGTFLNLSEILLKEATEAGIIQKNPHAGKPVPSLVRGGVVSPIESGQDKRAKGVNPRFFSK
jgi:flagellar biosynthesis GTPase FlhF